MALFSPWPLLITDGMSGKAVCCVATSFGWLWFSKVAFLVNSVARSSWAETQPYSNHTTARNVLLLRGWTLGEGNHNFHHTFPSDYRNGILWYEHDPSRWIILGLSKLGLVYELKTTSNEEIDRARPIQSGCETQPHHHGTAIMPSLPQINWLTYINQVKEGCP